MQDISLNKYNVGIIMFNVLVYQDSAIQKLALSKKVHLKLMGI